MQAPQSVTIHLPDEAATTRLGRLLAACLGPGDALLLSGPVGAGKTHLARAVIATRLAARGLAEDIPSPTFTIVQTYDDGETEIWHTDLYRLTSADDLVELGLDEAFRDAIVLVEWPDRLGDLAPPGALHITLAATPDGAARDATLSGPAERWRDRLGAIATEMTRETND